MKFKPGQKVNWQLRTPFGEPEKSIRMIHSIENNVVYLENTTNPGEPETGITYNLKSGQEIECFIPGFRASISPIKET